MPSDIYGSLIQKALEDFGNECVISIDLETIIHTSKDFLTGERIIAVSLSYMIGSQVETEIFIARDDTDKEEDRILLEFDRRISELKPSVIIGYNHVGYDLPLLRMKMIRRGYSRQLWNIKRYTSISYCPDMMYIIADDLFALEGDYRLRKLSDVVIHPGYSELDLQRNKFLSVRSGQPVNEAIEEMWKNEPENFILYCSGDTADLISIFFYIFKGLHISSKQNKVKIF